MSAAATEHLERALGYLQEARALASSSSTPTPVQGAESSTEVLRKLDALTAEVKGLRSEVQEMRQREPGPAMTIPRACEVLQCSKSRVHELITDGSLVKAPKLGKRTQVTTASVYRLLEHSRQEEAKVKQIRQRTNASLDAELDTLKVG